MTVESTPIVVMPAHHPGKRGSARALLSRLIWIYQGGCAAALSVTLLLVALGLELEPRQWLIIFAMMPAVVAIYNLADVAMIARHCRPVGHALRLLDTGWQPPEAVVAEALVRALNLPFYSFMRVTFLHGPLVTSMVCLSLFGANRFVHGGYESWQILTFAATAMFFASPSHAIYEYFAVSRSMIPTILRLSSAMGDGIPQRYHRRLIAVRLRSKLLYLAVGVTALPLIFFAASMVFKIERAFLAQGLQPSMHVMLPIYAWIAGVVLVCLAGSIVMAVLTAQEVSRSASRLVRNMQLVESGRLDEVAIEVISTDEYADIFRGFQHMLAALREEQRILAISQDLAGELRLDLLIGRIMQATTELLDAERSTLFIHDPRTDELYSFYADGELSHEIRLASTHGIAGAVFTSGEATNIADAYADPRFDPEVDRRTGFRTRSILCQPIIDKHGGRIGVTQVLNKRGGRFQAKDEARLRAFSAQIAVSIENAKLFDDVSRMKNYTESILKSTSNGIITFDMEDRIVTANTAALGLIGADAAIIGRGLREVFNERNDWIARQLEGTDWLRETQLAVDSEITRAGAPPASVNLTAAPLIDADEKRIGSMLVMEDITKEKRVRSTMARYMSKEVADQLLEGGESELIGKDQTVSILFADIRGFTNIAEAISARGTVAMLNEYFTEMVDVILAHGGILDKYIGDAMMALFGAPFAGPSDAQHAVEAANQMLVALAGLNRARVGAGQQPLDVGLGISTGEVIVGNIGSVKRMEYTVIGDSVNLASRLEGANKVYGTKILFSEYTMGKLVAPTLVREIDLIQVKGKERPVAVYESLGYRSAQIDRGLGAMLEAFGRGIGCYRARAWRDAEHEFRKALAADPHDRASAIYVDRCRQFAGDPPPADWGGVWMLSSK